ncbi:MAG: hypothetical protein MRY76_00835, partial [Pseudomonadales bacterium]|nr:hypothetical protein [Pseudomonadales bacterium]
MTSLNKACFYAWFYLFFCLFFYCLLPQISNSQAGVKGKIQFTPVSACSGSVCHDSSQFDCSLPFSGRGNVR